MVGNHLLQHRGLSATAIGVAAYIQSLPDGAPVGIKALADRFPEGEIRLGSALRELERYGYLERRRERLEGGRVVTRTYSYNKPGATPGGPPPPPPPPTPPPAPPPRDEEPPRLPPEPEPPTEPAPVSQRVHPRAVEVLTGLRRYDPRLLLSERDVARLAPAMSAWLERGIDPEAVGQVLSANLPEPLRSAASVLGYRLTALIPPPLPPVRAVAEAVRRRPDPFQTCDGCERAFRAPQPGGRCGDCPPVASEAA
ncbi:helix-turn-helix domain-containing protein [Streptomyces sp. NPDC048340]|uniref:helix-turn-helix domain-containing protein n=1 Tax=Streptomyces sp. NPDC048340 TaxID=3365537 RepID=UPI0037205392